MTIRAASWIAVLTIVVLTIGAKILAPEAGRQPLKEVYTPSFPRVPPREPTRVTLQHLYEDLRSAQGQQWVRRIVPDQSGVIWLALLIALAVAFDFEKPVNPRNIDLLAMLAIGFCLFDVLRLAYLLRSPTYVHLMDWVFSAVFFLNVFLLCRALWRVYRPFTVAWRPTLKTPALMTIALVLLLCDVVGALVREPDDAGYYINVGAQRLRERHMLPYGDPLLTGSPGAAYAPLLYIAHLPFQFALAPTPVNDESPDLPQLGPQSHYYLPPMLATKLCAIAFHFVSVIALLYAGYQLAGAQIAWALVALFCGSPYLLGVGGQDYYIGGMTFISHVAPAAMTLCAFAAVRRPGLAGVLLAVAAGVGFYPAFMLPAWLGYYWDRPGERWRFLAGFLVVALLIGGMTLLLSQPANGRGLLGTILFDTFGHHTDPRHYGSSPFGFWGQRTGIRGWLMHPLLAGSDFTTPFFLCFLGLTVACFGIARRANDRQLALITAVVAIAATLLKIHPTGTYVAWYYPFLLLGLFA